MIPGVAIAGRAGSGKSTLARELVAAFKFWDVEAEVHSFATALKEEVWELYGLKKGDVGSREALIEHGERRRAEDPLYWVRRAQPGIEACLGRGAVPLVDDLRRLPEYEWVTASGFYRVRVIAPELRRRRRLEEQGLDPNFAVSADPTETDHEGWLYDSRFASASPRHLRDAARLVAGRLARLAA